MRQRKFTMWCFAFIGVVCVMFASSHAMADFTTCSTTKLGDGSWGEVIAITDGGFPLFFADKDADATNKLCLPGCVSTSSCVPPYSNNPDDYYPCMVYRYKSVAHSGPGTPPPNFSTQKLHATIPVCPDELIINNQAFDGLSVTTGLSGNYVRNMKSLIIPGCAGSGSEGTEHFCNIAVKVPEGMTVGLGVNNMIFEKEGSNDFYLGCNSGILGPSCYTKVESKCDPRFSSAQTTNVCLPNVNGHVLKLNVQNKKILAVYECPAADTECLKPVCSPDPGTGTTCDTGTPPLNQCVQQATYEANVSMEINEGTPDIPNWIPLGLQCEFVDGKVVGCETLSDVGGTSEESIGYFVLKDSPQDPDPIICLYGQSNGLCLQ